MEKKCITSVRIEKNLFYYFFENFFVRFSFEANKKGPKEMQDFSS
jgi:hypothetical protein